MISADLFQNLCALIHPQTFPLAIKFLEAENQMPEKTVRPSKYGIKISLCQWTKLIEDLVEGLERTQDKGTRYPIQKYMIYEPPILNQMKELDQYLFPVSE
jgi:hypothetical protein